MPMSSDHKATVEKVRKLSGAEFDKAYVAEMVKDHQSANAEFETASRTAQNPDVKSFAAKTLPVIQSHLQKIEAIAAEGRKK
jgi:putative membrane protein